MATPKSDKVQIDFNLDKIDIPEELRPQKFVFRGERFETVNPTEIPFADIEQAYMNQSGQEMLTLFLGPQAKKFWALKPGILHVKAFNDALQPVIKHIVGEPGESGDSETP